MIAAVPEPGTTALCGVGLLLVVRRFGARGTALAAVERGLSRVAEFVTSDGAWLRRKASGQVEETMRQSHRARGY